MFFAIEAQDQKPDAAEWKVMVIMTIICHVWEIDVDKPFYKVAKQQVKAEI